MSPLHDKDCPCLACGKCAKDKNRCAQEDDFNALYEVLTKADGLIVGSPVYFGSATPDLMAFLDRAGYVARMGDNVFARKVGTPIVVARRAGVNFTYAQLLFFFTIMGMVVPGSTYWPIAYGREQGEVLKDEEGMENHRLPGGKLRLAVEESEVGFLEEGADRGADKYLCRRGPLPIP